ncbi:MAG: hypothetical protein AAF944_09825 [Bacteroidota bacterium]
MNNTTDDRTIQRYLDGDMSSEERREFESQLATDAELQQEVKEYEQLQQAILFQKRRAVWNKVQQLEAQSADNTISIDRNTNKTNWLPLAIAASVALLVIVGLFFWDQRALTPQELASQNFTPFMNEFVFESRSETSSIKQKAFSAYDNKNYKQAIEYFEQYESNSKDMTSTFFLGNTYLATEDYESAIEVFEKYLNNYDVYVEDATWYLFLSYLGAGNLERARWIAEDKKRFGQYSTKVKNIEYLLKEIKN